MKLYQSPGGQWAGTEKDWKAAIKAEGVDPKTVSRKIVEVPTDKAGLLEFLTFHNVNVINPGTASAVSAQVAGGVSCPPPPAAPPAAPNTDIDLDTAFMAAPLGQQLTLAAIALEEARSRIK